MCTDGYEYRDWILRVKRNNVLIGMKSKKPVNVLKTAARGRPRAFDPDVALERALGVFWKRGYEGASLPELTAAMGINRPSLYAAFGNKEALFRKALDRYMEHGSGMLADALAEPTAKAAVERLLKAAIAKPARGKIGGCLLVQGALACGQESDPIRRELIAKRGVIETMLHARFKRAIADGDLPARVDPKALAKYVATLQQGIAVQMASGANHDDLNAMINIALSDWPV